MRHAFKLFYDGRRFHGSQMQPGVRTVEGELRGSLSELGVDFEGLRLASRTDKGVSALSNCFAFSTDSKLVAPRVLNDRLPGDIRILAMKRVEEAFDPRYAAEEKVYKYFLPCAGLDLEKVSRALKVIEGEHSFHNFALLEGQDPVRCLERAEASVGGGVLVLTFSAQGFLWQQLRRLVTALVRVGKGELKAAELERYFDVEHEEKVPPSPGEGLVLWDIKYPFQFELEEYSTRILTARLKERRDKLTTDLEMDSQILDFLWLHTKH